MSRLRVHYIIDEMHPAVSPILLGAGEHLLGGIDLLRLGYECTEHVPTAHTTHVVLMRKRSSGSSRGCADAIRHDRPVYGFTRPTDFRTLATRTCSSFKKAAKASPAR